MYETTIETFNKLVFRCHENTSCNLLTSLGGGHSDGNVEHDFKLNRNDTIKQRTLLAD